MNTAGGPVRSEGGGELATWGGWLVRIEGEGGSRVKWSAVRLAFLNQRLQVNKVR